MNDATGGPAFPQTSVPYKDGMSLRDYFAAKAMVAILTMPDNDNDTYGEDARHAYLAADAMLEARKA